MAKRTTRLTKAVLTGLNTLGVDRLYQQMGSELGLVLTFHHVKPQSTEKFDPNAHLSITPEFLETTLDILEARGFEVISMDDLPQRIANPRRDKRFAALTFDDGYKNTATLAAPILKQRNLPYTIYFATGLINGTSELWWDAIAELVRKHDTVELGSGYEKELLRCDTVERKYAAYGRLLGYLTQEVPELDQARTVHDMCARYDIDLGAIRTSQLMQWDEIAEIAKDPLCTIGAHSVNHYALARLSKERARQEMEEGASEIEKRLSQRPDHFAFPYGYPTAAASREFDLAKDVGFKTAVTTRAGHIFASHLDHMTALPRVSVNGLYQSRRHFAPLTTGLPTRLGTGISRLNVA